MKSLNHLNVPKNLISLISMAEKWGIGDDFEREQEILAASPEDLYKLVHAIDEITDEDFYGWLSGPESHYPRPSNEFTALSNLAMPIDSAQTKLRNTNE